ncbi:MAG: hypothetical protein ABMB14_16885, partial [Myxococcota bacterium]
MGQNQVRAGTNGKRWFGALVLGWIAAGCARDPVRLVEPDPARTGEPGVDGPYGVARLDLRVPARVTDAIPVAVVYPADDALGPAVAGAPAVVFVHGGGVVPDRYVWLASHLATRGYAVVLPEAWLDLAIFEPGNGALALDA